MTATMIRNDVPATRSRRCTSETLRQPSRRPASCARFHATRSLINEGDIGDVAATSSCRARVKVYASNEAGREFVIDFHGAGRIRRRDDARRRAALGVGDDGRADDVRVVNRAQFRDFMLAHPDFAMHLIDRLIHRRARHDRQPEEPRAIGRLRPPGVYC